jgi:hypothetical protein
MTTILLPRPMNSRRLSRKLEPYLSCSYGSLSKVLRQSNLTHPPILQNWARFQRKLSKVARCPTRQSTDHRRPLSHSLEYRLRNCIAGSLSRISSSTIVRDVRVYLVYACCVTLINPFAENLKALLIIPRSPSPVPLEDRDVDSLNASEMRELLKRQKVRRRLLILVGGANNSPGARGGCEEGQD